MVCVAEESGTVSVCVEMASDGNLFRNVEIRVVSQDGNAIGNYIATPFSVAMFHSPSL